MYVHISLLGIYTLCNIAIYRISALMLRLSLAKTAAIMLNVAQCEQLSLRYV